MSATAQFNIGQRVKAVSFTDCFGKLVPERSGLTITESRLVEPSSIKPYYRVVAREPNGLGYVEGAESFFEAEV